MIVSQSSQPPGYNTTMKNRLSTQVSTVSSVGSGHFSMRHQGSQMSVQSRPRLPSQSEEEIEIKSMKPVVPQPGV